MKRVFLENVDDNDEEFWRQLDHRNIVKLFHCESDMDFRYYAFELCDASLDQLFLDLEDPKSYNGPMPHHIDALLQLALGLEHIHSKNFIHGDIKPQNVLIAVGTAGQDEMTLKWANFGLIRNVSERGKGKKNQVGGNNAWLSPELLSLKLNRDVKENNDQDIVKSDVFAQGLVFGSLFLNGEHLYGSTENENEIPGNVIEGNPINMQKIDGKLRNCYGNDLLKKMLENDPDKRMTSTQVVNQLKVIKDKIAGKEKELLELCGSDSRLDLTEKIQNFIQFRINLNAKGDGGRNALHLLCQNYSSPKLTDAIQLLIENKINVNARDNHGRNAIHYLCRYHSSQNLINTIQILIQYGIEAKASTNDGSNALHYLCRYNSSQNLDDAIKIFTNLGLDLMTEDNNGWSALHYLREGGFGQVLKGKFGGCEVAVKQVELHRVKKREEDAMLKLEHPNLVKLLHCESDDDYRNYALELCDASLDKLFLDPSHPLKYKRPMPRHSKVFHQLAVGLEYIHSKNLIHRDIKPQNVLISVRSTGQGNEVIVKWADFGLSKPVNERGTCPLGDIRGTKIWFAPETVRQLQKRKSEDTYECTVQGDIFAQALVFGCLLLNGEHLYGCGETEIHDNIIGKNPVNMQKINGELRKCYEDDLLMKMLEDDPQIRITSKEVVKQLESINKMLTEKEEELRQLCVRDSSSGLIEKINDLIQLGIDVNAKDDDGQNALHFLCENNSNSNLLDAINVPGRLLFATAEGTQYTLRVTQDCFCEDLDFYGFPYDSVVIVAVAQLNYAVACQHAEINIPEPIVPRNSIDTTACSSESMKRDENTTENEANLSTLVIFKNFMTEELFGSQSKFYDSTFASCGTYIVVECDMNAICCNVAGSDTYLVMSDANEAVTVGEEVIRDAGNVARCADSGGGYVLGRTWLSPQFTTMSHRRNCSATNQRKSDFKRRSRNQAVRNTGIATLVPAACGNAGQQTPSRLLNLPPSSIETPPAQSHQEEALPGPSSALPNQFISRGSLQSTTWREGQEDDLFQPERLATTEREQPIAPMHGQEPEEDIELPQSAQLPAVFLGKSAHPTSDRGGSAVQVLQSLRDTLSSGPATDERSDSNGGGVGEVGSVADPETQPDVAEAEASAESHEPARIDIQDLQRHAATRAVTARFKNNPESLEKLQAWVADLAFLQDLARAARNPQSKSARALVARVTPHIKTTSSTVPYSTAQRKASMQHLYALAQHFGMPSIFLTYAPDFASGVLNPRLSLPSINNVELPASDDGILEALRQQLDIHQNIRLSQDKFQCSPCLNERLASNPVAMGEFFRLLTNSIFTILVGLKPEGLARYTPELPSRKLGLFGVLLASFGVVEEQARGTPHCHAIVWGGLPPSLLQSTAGTPRLLNVIAGLLDRMVTAELEPETIAQHLLSQFNRNRLVRVAIFIAHCPVNEPREFTEDVQRADGPAGRGEDPRRPAAPIQGSSDQQGPLRNLVRTEASVHRLPALPELFAHTRSPERYQPPLLGAAAAHPARGRRQSKTVASLTLLGMPSEICSHGFHLLFVHATLAYVLKKGRHQETIDAFDDLQGGGLSSDDEPLTPPATSCEDEDPEEILEDDQGSELPYVVETSRNAEPAEDDDAHVTATVYSSGKEKKAVTQAEHNAYRGETLLHYSPYEYAATILIVGKHLGKKWRTAARAFAQYMLLVYRPWLDEGGTLPGPLTWKTLCDFMRDLLFGRLQEIGSRSGPTPLDNARRRWIENSAQGLRISAEQRIANQLHRNRKATKWDNPDDHSGNMMPARNPTQQPEEDNRIEDEAQHLIDMARVEAAQDDPENLANFKQRQYNEDTENSLRQVLVGLARRQGPQRASPLQAASMINAERPETTPTTRSVLKAFQADVTDSGSSREDDDIVLFGPERQQQPAGDPIKHNAPLNSQQAAVMSLCTLYFQEKVQHSRGAGSRLQPLRFLVHGGPGTGKSFLAKRIQERTEEMGLQIACVALTGIAAGIMPQGTTCHHRLAIRCGTTRRRPTPLQREKLLQLQCKLQKESLAMVIIDEVCFVTPEMLDIIAGRLAEIMGVDSIDPAPGDVSAPTAEPLAIVLMGDFFQLPPVPPDTLFTALINQFQMRAAEDARHITMLEQMRTPALGIPRNQLSDIAHLKTLSCADVLADPEWSAAPIVVTSNSKRQHINQLQSAKWVAWKGVPRIIWRLEIGGELAAHLPPRVRERIYVEFPQFTGSFVHGAPGYLTSNINPARGLSNGTAVLFESIELDPREDADWICNDIATAAEDTNDALTYPPLHINVAVPGSNAADFVEKTLKPGRVVIPVPRVSKWEPVNIKLPGRRQADTFHYQPHGVEQRFAVTVNKIQGQTCNKVIIQLNKRSFMPRLTFSMLYAALSRV
ncbi:Uncharacterized protein APZ42_034213 [Daphnia magna]|uniref:ATP-dependent DNA helicase n=1 Tax=Daphnia magna TaxID=35525 RepID=A0A164KC15_9CRUS|nr:Uncharacterized protein APZ42_034213 [Daphnia magna]